MSDLGRVELRSLQGLRHSICNRIDRVEIIPAAGASRGGCDTGALAGGVIYGRVNIVSPAEPVDAEHDHEEHRQHDSSFSDFGAAGTKYDFFHSGDSHRLSLLQACQPCNASHTCLAL